MKRRPIPTVDQKAIAEKGYLTVKPGKNEVLLSVGTNTAFMSMSELYTFMRTLDHHAYAVWGDTWVQHVKGTA